MYLVCKSAPFPSSVVRTLLCFFFSPRPLRACIESLSAMPFSSTPHYYYYYYYADTRSAGRVPPGRRAAAA